MAGRRGKPRLYPRILRGAVAPAASYRSRHVCITPPNADLREPLVFLGGSSVPPCPPLCPLWFKFSLAPSPESSGQTPPANPPAANTDPACTPAKKFLSATTPKSPSPRGWLCPRTPPRRRR